MPVEQAGTTPPETQSYDSEMLADVRGAFEEVSKAPAAVVTEKPAETVEVKPGPVAKVEPDKPVVAEPKADHPTDPARYADGTFKPTKAEAEPKPDAAKIETVDKPVVQQPAAPVVATPTVNPPGGWSPKSKAEWEKLPEHIRADIAKREKEVADGFAQYEGMRELRPYVDLARSQGQTLKQALDRYVNLENTLRQRPLDTLVYLAGSVGFSPQRLAQELAPHLGPSTGQALPDQGSQQQIDPTTFQQWLNPLKQELTTLQSQVQQFQQADQQRFQTAYNAAQVRFTADPAHRFFENVRPQMTQLFASGFVTETGDIHADLKAAYDMACNMNPEIRELLLNERMAKTEEARKRTEQETAEKARLASRSITGSPSSGPVKDTTDQSGDSIEDDVRRAYRAHAA